MHNSINSLHLVEQLKALAIRSELPEAKTNSYISWVLRYIRFHNKCRPEKLGKQAVEQFLSHIGTELNYDRSTQLIALNALNFLYKNLFKIQLTNLHYQKKTIRRGFLHRFGKTHCQSVINEMSGTTQLIVKLSVETNLKLNEVINLRLFDIDFKKNEIKIRNRKSEVKLTVNIPLQLILDLKIQSIRVRRLKQLRQSKERDKQFSQITILKNQAEAECEFLFPATCQDKNANQTTYLSRIPMSVVKNDIRIAIRCYMRFQPENHFYVRSKLDGEIRNKTSHAHISNPANARINYRNKPIAIGNISNKTHSDKDISNDTLSSDNLSKNNFLDKNLPNRRKYRQTSFNFEHNLEADKTPQICMLTN